MKTICVISARGGSRGVPGKNIRIINGKPLIVFLQFVKQEKIHILIY